MNAEEIRLMLTKVVSDLKYIESCDALRQVAVQPDASGELGLMASAALDMAIAFKLKYAQAIDTQRLAAMDEFFWLDDSVDVTDMQQLRDEQRLLAYELTRLLEES